MIGNYIFPGVGPRKENGVGLARNIARKAFIRREISEIKKPDSTEKKYCSVAQALADFDGGICTGNVYVNGGDMDGRSVLPDVCEFADSCEIRVLTQITGIRVAKKI